MTLYERSVQSRIYENFAKMYRQCASLANADVAKHWNARAAESSAKARAVKPEDERGGHDQ